MIPTPERPETNLAGWRLEHPLLNAAGTAKSVDDIERLARSAVSAVTVGSITLEPRTGNAGEVYAPRDGYAVNALGMPNRGLAHYAGAAGDPDDAGAIGSMAAVTRAADKPLIVSVAGFSPAEYGTLAGRAAAAGADLVELNLGCPNVWDDGSQHRIASFDPSLVARSVWAAAVAVAEATAAAPRAPGTPPVALGVKLSPLGDPVLLAEVAAVLAESPARFVVSCNTFPNGLVLREDGRAAIDVGYGGVSGPAMKPIALGQISQLRALLPDRIDLVGAGGVRSGADIHDLLRAGAAAVGVATAFWNAEEDPRVFGDLLADWVG